MNDNKYNQASQSPLQGVGGMGVEGASLAIRTTPQAVYIDAGSGERAHQRGTLRYAVTARQLVIYPAQGYEPVAAARFDRGITVDGTPLTPDNAEEPARRPLRRTRRQRHRPAAKHPRGRHRRTLHPPSPLKGGA